MTTKLLLILGLLATTSVAWGQTACPQGVSPGDPRCGPSSGVQGFDMTPPPSGPSWQLTWGAIAMDSVTGVTGVTVGHFSRGKAKREAMAQCKKSGGTDCKVMLAYKNQCAVIAEPTENGKSIGGISIYQGGPSVQAASELANSACSGKRGGGECSIVYSDCTRPALVN